VYGYPYYGDWYDDYEFGADGDMKSLLAGSLALMQRLGPTGKATLADARAFNPNATQADVDAVNVMSPSDRQQQIASLQAMLGPVGVSTLNAGAMSTGEKVGIGVGLGVLVVGLMTVVPFSIYFIAKGLGATKGVAIAAALGIPLGFSMLTAGRDKSPPRLGTSPVPQGLPPRRA
jgi:hypothetical protein